MSVRGSLAALPARGLMLLVRLYRATLSHVLPPSCRFEPSCSRYAEEALRVHGARRGGWLTLKRLARCRPGCPGGYDPVPPPDPPGAAVGEP